MCSRCRIHPSSGGGGHRSEFFALFDRGRGDLEVFLAVVVTRASGYEARIQRGPDDERYILLADGGKKLVHGASVIDQRILPGAQTNIGIGVIHDLEDG